MKKNNKNEMDRANHVSLRFEYLKFGQALNTLIYAAQQARDELEIAMIKKGMKKRERRANGDRRGGLN